MQEKTLILVSSGDVPSNKSKRKYAEMLAHLDFKMRILPFIKKQQEQRNNQCIIVFLDKLSEQELKKGGVLSKSSNTYHHSEIYNGINEKAIELIEDSSLYGNICRAK